MTGGDARTFTPFMRLPLELRIQIWSHTAFERHVDVELVKEPDSPPSEAYSSMCRELRRLREAGPSAASELAALRKRHKLHHRRRWVHIRSSRPAPAVMQACSESRRYGPYQKAFTAGYDPRYIWSNFEKDMFCVDSRYICDDAVEDHESEIQRLRSCCWGWEDVELLDENADNWLSYFPKLREFHLVDYDNPLQSWSTRPMRKSFFATNGREDFRIIDEQSGLMLTLPQLDMVENFHWYHAFDDSGSSLAEEEQDEENPGPVRISLSEMHLME